jgi:hypothetical protein
MNDTAHLQALLTPGPSGIAYRSILLLAVAIGSLTVATRVDALGASANDRQPQLLFKDSLKEPLATEWGWLRPNEAARRHSEHGLEIRVEPGKADTVKNALLRPAPDRSTGKHAIEITIELLSPPTQQYEQAGLTWYQGGKPALKLVHEFIDGKTYIIPGKKPTSTRLMQLRLIVDRDQYTAQFRPDAKGEFQTAATGKLPPGQDEKISIQCYNGPANAEHWIHFSDFKIYRMVD